MKQLLFICTLITMLSACTGNGILEKEKNYTPLSLYYNPFQPTGGLFIGDGDSPEYSYPNFLNYPNDWTKHGLRGQVALVSYIYRDITYAEFCFNEKGNLLYTGSYLDAAKKLAEVRAYQYDSLARLNGVFRNPHIINFPENMQHFEYDASGKLIKRKGGTNNANQTFTYYENGTLKEIIPHIYNDLLVSLHGKMEFNEFGELVKEDMGVTANPLWSNADYKFRSNCTFAYANNGSCIHKEETLYSRRTDKRLDSICCHSTYTYNAKGDIAQWDYSDYIFKDSTYRPGNNLTFLFEYKYDKHDNWTIMKIIYPDYYTENREALDQIADIFHTMGELNLGSKDLNENATITIDRKINYHSPVAMSDQKASSSKAEKKLAAPEFTAVQGRGLYGKVKSVSNDKYTVYFTEDGNIARKAWKSGEYVDYYYQSPTRYKIGTEIGPFRIICDGKTRKEEDEKGIEVSTEYDFDAQNRVVRYKYADGMTSITETYKYIDNDLHPNCMQMEAPYEEGEDVSTSEYIYQVFDEQGNWIKRRVSRTWQYTEYIRGEEGDSEKTSTKVDPEFVETRVITYY